MAISAAHISTSDKRRNNPSTTSSNEVTEGTIVTGKTEKTLMKKICFLVDQSSLHAE